MLINEKLIKFIFSKHNFIKYGGTILLILVSIAMVTGFILYQLYTDTYNKQLDILTKAKTTIPYTTSQEDALIYQCRVIGCKALSIEEGDQEWFYKINIKPKNTLDPQRSQESTMQLLFMEDKELTESLFSSYFTDEYNLIIRDGNVKYVLNDNSYILSAVKATIYISIIMSLTFGVFTIVNLYSGYKNDIYEKGSYKMYVENKLQANVTEMIHHEINAPLAIINALVDSVRDIIKDSHKIEEHKKILDGFDYAVERIESVLGLLSESKHMKYAKGDVSIGEIIKHIVTNVNKFKVGSVKLEFNNFDILDKYSIHAKLGNGNLMNILHILVNNSIEAKADKLLFTPVEVGDDFIELYISDNGHGVRDHNNNIIKTDSIFEYGYSTKDNKGQHVLSKSKLNRFLKFFNIGIMSTDTTRGIGLYMNKMLLYKVNGDIELYKTSATGTTFKLTLPVEICLNKVHNDKA